ncbi:MAG: FRG domain-containing protein [Phycisphaerae bacterium]|jgi:hypothetical protein
MNGQWIGKHGGTNSGSIIVNCDDRGDYYEGVAYIGDSIYSLPSLAAVFKTNNRDNDFKFRTQVIMPINRLTGGVDSWENCKKLYADDTILPKYADVKGCWDSESLTLEWTTDIGTGGFSKLPKTNADKPSEYNPINTDWIGFKEFVSTLEGRRLLFRGQNKPWRLRTAFHRTERANLARFVTEDISALYKNLSARTKHLFNLSVPDENGAFYNLLQHHGYPTPLLDWTCSPYVAAFFAYRSIDKNKASLARDDEKVRILVFDYKQWAADLNQILSLNTAALHLSTCEFIAIENERMIPQQSVSTITNIDDIESYIQLIEKEKGKSYLKVIDLPVTERTKVMRELSFMGITAGSLFPGLDGACEELKERFFNL